MCSGDLLTHGVSKITGIDDFLDFVVKTTDVVLQEFQIAFPDIPIITALGNNDGVDHYDVCSCYCCSRCCCFSSCCCSNSVVVVVVVVLVVLIVVVVVVLVYGS